jgi:hypothetical protein
MCRSEYRNGGEKGLVSRGVVGLISGLEGSEDDRASLFIHQRERFQSLDQLGGHFGWNIFGLAACARWIADRLRREPSFVGPLTA